MMSLKFRTKTTCVPSGEIRGSLAVSKSNRSIGRNRLAATSEARSAAVVEALPAAPDGFSGIGAELSAATRENETVPARRIAMESRVKSFIGVRRMGGGWAVQTEVVE